MNVPSKDSSAAKAVQESPTETTFSGIGSTKSIHKIIYSTFLSIALSNRFTADERDVFAALYSLKSIRLPWCRKKEPAEQAQSRMAPTKVRKRELYDTCRLRRPFAEFAVENYPKGFPKLARFLDSDDAFMVYRRFGSTFSRLLLNKQDQMSRLEATLNAMDRTDDSNGDGEYLMSHALDVDRDSTPEVWSETRPELLEKLEKMALEYGKLLTTISRGSNAYMLQRICSLQRNNSKIWIVPRLETTKAFYISWRMTAASFTKKKVSLSTKRKI